MNDTLDGLIRLPHLRVENANAISGPLSWGFPPPSAFTGFVHALHRRVGNEEFGLDGVGIVCHRFDPQVHKSAGKFTYRFNLARHPMGKDGKPPGTIEEGRAHIEISLLIGVSGDLDQEYEGPRFAERVWDATYGMRLAGGSVLPAPEGKRHRAEYIELSGTREGDEAHFRRLRRQLLPGFALIGRHRLLSEYLAELRERRPEATALDALLDLIRIKVEPVAEDLDAPDRVTWHTSRQRPGWLVPLPTGYGAISSLHPAGTVTNARDDATPFRFVESLYSLGEWVSPHRLTHPQQLLWYHRANPDAGLYLCEQPPE